MRITLSLLFMGALTLVSAIACPRPAVQYRCNSAADCGLSGGPRVCVDSVCSDAAGDAGHLIDDAGDVVHVVDDAGHVVFDGGALVDGGFALDDAGSSDAGTPGCGFGTHDGGDGACVDLGSCSSGFAPAFVDSDGDGHGQGALGTACLSVPPPAGFSANNDDCDDANPSAFVVVTGFIDDEGDGYTAGPRSACTDGSLPAATIAVERLAPVLLSSPDVTSAQGSNGWNSAGAASACCGGTTAADLDLNAGTAVLTLSDYVCSAVPRRIDVIRVHIRAVLGPHGSAVSANLNTEITLAVAGVAGTAVTASHLWLPFADDFIVEGAPAQWGVNVGADNACNGSLEVRVRVLPNGVYNDQVAIDFVTVEIDGVDDCDPAGPAFAPVTVYSDGDGDSHFGLPAVATCVDQTVLTTPDRTTVNDDCDNDDDNTFPGQTAFFSIPRSDGSFDYNCDGTSTQLAVNDVQTCTDNVDGLTCDSTSVPNTGNCGELVSANTCNGAVPCAVVPGAAAQACR